MDTIYFLGAPATGKTTLVKLFTEHWFDMESVKTPIAYRIQKDLHSKDSKYNIQLGKTAPVYAGTDTLSFTAIDKMPDLYELWNSKDKIKYILGEGDRLANRTYFDLAKEYGNLHIFYLELDENIRQNRSLARSMENNLSKQNLTWQKGRLTKHKKLAKEYNAHIIECGYMEYGAYIEKSTEDLYEELLKCLV